MGIRAHACMSAVASSSVAMFRPAAAYILLQIRGALQFLCVCGLMRIHMYIGRPNTCRGSAWRAPIGPSPRKLARKNRMHHAWHQLRKVVSRGYMHVWLPSAAMRWPPHTGSDTWHVRTYVCVCESAEKFPVVLRFHIVLPESIMILFGDSFWRSLTTLSGSPSTHACMSRSNEWSLLCRDLLALVWEIAYVEALVWRNSFLGSAELCVPLCGYMFYI